MTAEQMQQEAEELSYLGQQLGNDDDLLSYSGSQTTLVTPNQSDRRYGFRLNNPTDAQKTVALHRGFFNNNTELSSYLGVTINGDLTALGAAATTTLHALPVDSRFPLSGLELYTRLNPTGMWQMVINGNSNEAWNSVIRIYKISPFTAVREVALINLDEVFSEYQQTDKKITIDLRKWCSDFQFDAETVVTMTLPGTDVIATTGARLKITLHASEVLSVSTALSKKRDRAHTAAQAIIPRIKPGGGYNPSDWLPPRVGGKRGGQRNPSGG
jgi:hypothetical protein